MTQRERDLIGLNPNHYAAPIRARLDGWTARDLAKLSVAEKAWLARFNREEIAGDWRANESDRWLSDWSDPAERSRVYNQLNAARRDIQTLGETGTPIARTTGGDVYEVIYLDSLDQEQDPDDDLYEDRPPQLPIDRNVEDEMIDYLDWKKGR